MTIPSIGNVRIEFVALHGSRSRRTERTSGTSDVYTVFEEVEFCFADPVGAAAAKLVHAPLSVHSPTELPGVEPYVHQFAVQRWPL